MQKYCLNFKWFGMAWIEYFIFWCSLDYKRIDKQHNHIRLCKQCELPVRIIFSELKIGIVLKCNIVIFEGNEQRLIRYTTSNILALLLSKNLKIMLNDLYWKRREIMFVMFPEVLTIVILLSQKQWLVLKSFYEKIICKLWKRRLRALKN